MKNKEEEKAFRGIKEIGAEIARLASIQEQQRPDHRYRYSERAMNMNHLQAIAAPIG